MWNPSKQIYDMIIVGGGPAGLTSATYARRAGKSVLILEKAAFGGQITWSPKVENFPGILSAAGTELGDRLLEQAMEQGAEVELEEIASVEKVPEGFLLTAESGQTWQARSVINATGAKPRRTGLSGEEQLIGNGICFCAVCDGAFFRGKSVAVYGGGNSALQDAVLLSELCSKVTLIYRGEQFRGEQALVEVLEAKPNVEILRSTTISALLGEQELCGISVTSGNNSREIPVEGLFVAIGHSPDNTIFRHLCCLDEAGYVKASESCLTTTPGLFVAGDCRVKAVRQAVTACADGAAAALAACSYLDSQKAELL